MAVVAAFAAAPGDSSPIPSGWSNFFHVPVFFGLTLLWYTAFCRLGFSRWVSVISASALILLFGLAIELHQMNVPARYASRRDLALNGLGVGLAMLAGPLSSVLSACRNGMRFGGRPR